MVNFMIGFRVSVSISNYGFYCRVSCIDVGMMKAPFQTLTPKFYVDQLK